MRLTGSGGDSRQKREEHPGHRLPPRSKKKSCPSKFVCCVLMRHKTYVFPSNIRDASGSTQDRQSANGLLLGQRGPLLRLATRGPEPFFSGPETGAEFSALLFPPDYVVGKSDQIQKLYR